MSMKCLRRILNKPPKNARCECSRKVTSAGVVGDEILRGEVADTNSNFIAKQLHQLGLDLKKISVIGDNVTDISNEVRLSSKTFDYVLTTGGIGPTHDDVTYEGVAKAFNQPLYLNPEIKELCTKFYGCKEPTAAGMKLAYIPKTSRLLYNTASGGKLPYPIVAIENVYMFPGIPELLRKAISEGGAMFFKAKTRYFTKCFFCTIPEHRITKELQQVVDEYPDVKLGVYPKMFHSDYKVKVTVESTTEETTLKAYNKLMQLIPENFIVVVDEV